MLFGETVAVYCENHTEHINTLCGAECKVYVSDFSFRFCAVYVQRRLMFSRRFPRH
jgi:hypothetical protein